MRKKKLRQVRRCRCITSAKKKEKKKRSPTETTSSWINLLHLTVWLCSKPAEQRTTWGTKRLRLQQWCLMPKHSQGGWTLVSLILQLLTWRCRRCYRYYFAPVCCLCIYVLQPEEVYELLFHQAKLCCINDDLITLYLVSCHELGKDW